MEGENSKKKRRSVSLSKVIGIAMITLLIGILLGGFLGILVVEPELQKLHILFGDQGTTNDNNQNSNGNNNNSNSGQGSINNYYQSPSNPTASYGGTSQFDITMTQDGQTLSGTMTANTNCNVQQDGTSIQLSFEFTPTSVSGNIQQAINTGQSVTFNFAGTTSGSQFAANAKGNAGSNSNSLSFDIAISGTINQNQLTFTVTSSSNAQLKISTQQSITLNGNN